MNNLKNVKELYLKDNQISDFKQIEHLKNCPQFKILCLLDNPISKQSNYRQKILEILPNLKKLDDIDCNITNINNNPPPACSSFPKSSFILFKKIFPGRANKFKTNIKDLNTSEIEEINNNNNNNNANDNKNNNDVLPKSKGKSDLLNKSFQKKRTIGIFRIQDNKKTIIINLFRYFM